MSSAAAAVTTLAPRYTHASDIASGTVFHDKSGYGRRQPGDPGIAGVLVSNGVDVTRTDADGRWSLPVRTGCAPFVIKPSGWSLPQRDCGLPLLWSAPTETGTIEVPLTPTDEPSRFEVALLADTQPQTMRELDYFRDSILAAVMTTDAAFAINHGDIVFDAPELYPRYLRLVGATGIAWHHCPGNHDMDHTADPAHCFDTWRQVFGPSHYAFQHGGATFIVLNNVERLSEGGLTASGHSYRGAIGASQLAFVRNLLSLVPRDQLVVLSMHIPLVGLEEPLDPAGMTHDRSELLRLLSGRPHTVSFAGHTHTTEHHYLGDEHGYRGPGRHHHHVLTAACGSWWSGPFDISGLPIADSRDGTPKGFHVLSIDGASYTTRFVALGSVAGTQMRISIQGRCHGAEPGVDGSGSTARLSHSLTVDEARTSRLIVNVFDGGPRTQLTYKIMPSQGGYAAGRTVPTISMQRQLMVDPYLAEKYCRHRPELKPWVEPAASSHVWQAPLPETLACGVHQILVEGRDEYGRQISAACMIEVIA